MSNRSLWAVGLVSAAVLSVFAAYATGLGLKPGLWELKLVKQLEDGTDKSAQLAAAAAQMKAAMANLPPEQRARVQAMMPQAGVGLGDNGNFRICVTPEMAKRDQPVLDKDGHCQPAKISHDGNITTYEFSCTSNGSSRQGKGQSIAEGDTIRNIVDMTSERAGQTHQMHSESEMHYLGADCGDIKPVAPPAN